MFIAGGLFVGICMLVCIALFLVGALGIGPVPNLLLNKQFGEPAFLDYESVPKADVFCLHCGKAVEDDYRFCNSCGKRLKQRIADSK